MLMFTNTLFSTLLFKHMMFQTNKHNLPNKHTMLQTNKHTTFQTNTHTIFQTNLATLRLRWETSKTNQILESSWWGVWSWSRFSHHHHGHLFHVSILWCHSQCEPTYWPVAHGHLGCIHLQSLGAPSHGQVLHGLSVIRRWNLHYDSGQLGKCVSQRAYHSVECWGHPRMDHLFTPIY